MHPSCPEQKAFSVLFALCCLWLLAAPGIAWCQPMEPAASTDQPVDCLSEAKCSELYENARRLSQSGQYEAALVNYQSAYAQTPSLWLLVNIGRMQQKAGRLQQAVSTFRRFLDDPVAEQDAESLNKAREYLQQAEAASMALGQKSKAAAMAQEQKIEVKPRPPKELAPTYRKWWVWVGVGGATAVATIGLVVGLTARSPAPPAAPPSVPPGVSVYDPGF